MGGLSEMNSPFMSSVCDTDSGHIPSKAQRFAAAILAILCAIAFGVLHSLDGLTLYSYLRANANIRSVFNSCLAVNGILFLSLWAASFLFCLLRLAGLWASGDSALSPSGDSALRSALRSALSCGSGGGGGGGAGLARSVWLSVFDVMWVLPMYALTQGLGVRWYSALYAEAHAEKKRRAAAAAAASAVHSGASGGNSRRWEDSGIYNGSPADKSVPSSLSAVAVSISEILFKALVATVYSCVAVIVELSVPNVFGGPYLAFIMNSWLYALYVFDYRLSYQYFYNRAKNQHTRVSLFTSLRYFEQHWAYFLGFGATQSIIGGALRSSWFASSWFSVAAVTSVLYGAQVILSVEALPSPRAPFPLPMFTPFFALCGKTLGWISSVKF